MIATQAHSFIGSVNRCWTSDREETYHIVDREAESAAATVGEFAKANGQILLPLVELVTQARLAIDEVIDRIGRQTIETILTLSVEQVAGSRTPGKEQRRHPLARLAEWPAACSANCFVREHEPTNQKSDLLAVGTPHSVGNALCQETTSENAFHR